MTVQRDAMDLNRRDLLAAAAAAFAAACREFPRRDPGADAGSSQPRADGGALDAGAADAAVPTLARCAAHDRVGLRPSVGALDLPHLGGAPDTVEGCTVAAFVDTVIPGRHRDATGAPGGVDVGAPGVFFDPALPAAPYVGALVLFLNSAAQERFNGAFMELSPSEREDTLEYALNALSLVGFAVQLAKLAYFSSAGAACLLGYPGPNGGYVLHQDFSFRRAMSTEVTADGNYP